MLQWVWAPCRRLTAGALDGHHGEDGGKCFGRWVESSSDSAAAKASSIAFTREQSWEGDSRAREFLFAQLASTVLAVALGMRMAAVDSHV